MRFFEKLNTPKAVAVIAVFTIIVDGFLFYRSQLMQPTATSPTPAAVEPGPDATALADPGRQSKLTLAPSTVLTRQIAAPPIAAPTTTVSAPAYREPVYNDAGAAASLGAVHLVPATPTSAPAYQEEKPDYQQPQPVGDAPTVAAPTYRNDTAVSEFTPGGTAAQETVQSTTAPDTAYTEETAQTTTEDGPAGQIEETVQMTTEVELAGTGR